MQSTGPLGPHRFAEARSSIFRPVELLLEEDEQDKGADSRGARRIRLTMGKNG